jgi:hypothetical protein
MDATGAPTIYIGGVAVPLTTNSALRSLSQQKIGSDLLVFSQVETLGYKLSKIALRRNVLASAAEIVDHKNTSSKLLQIEPVSLFTKPEVTPEFIVKESPRFTTDNSVESRYNTLYNWSTDAGWLAIGHSYKDVALFPAWKAVDKLSTGSGDCWHSLEGADPFVTGANPQHFQIVFPYVVVLQSYSITARYSSSFTHFPRFFKVQGFNGGSWIDLEATREETAWDTFNLANITKTYTSGVNVSGAAFATYRLYITGARVNDTDLRNLAVAIGDWSLVVKDPTDPALDPYVYVPIIMS